MKLPENTLLEIKSLNLCLPDTKTKQKKVILQNINLNLTKGKSHALVGESGSGKSMLCNTILGLEPLNAEIQGSILFDNYNLLEKPYPQTVRGRKIAYIPQNPITSLNPVKNVKEHIFETLQIHEPQLKAPERLNYARELLLSLQLQNWEKVLNSYPFELSGGMCQRIMIALALCGKPELLLADEPTTALDVMVQAEIAYLLLEIIKKKNLTLLLISHDLALVAQMAEYIWVLKDGEIQEAGRLKEVFANPQSHYTQTLINIIKS